MTNLRLLPEEMKRLRWLRQVREQMADMQRMNKSMVGADLKHKALAESVIAALDMLDSALVRDIGSTAVDRAGDEVEATEAPR